MYVCYDYVHLDNLSDIYISKSLYVYVSYDSVVNSILNRAIKIKNL